MIKSFNDLDIYKLSYELANEISRLTAAFPSVEKYSLTSQIVRSSRSISANIAEGYGRRIYNAEFKKFLIYSTGSLEETRVWLSFAKDCKYINEQEYLNLLNKTNEIGAKLYKFYTTWR